MTKDVPDDLQFDEGISTYIVYIYFFPRHGTTPPVGQALLIIEASRSHSDTPQSVRLLWTRDQPVAETTHNSQKR
jgi:hypothetical protein